MNTFKKEKNSLDLNVLINYYLIFFFSEIYIDH